MVQPPYKSHNKGTKPNKDRSDTLLGDPIVNTKKNTKKAKATGQTDNIERMTYEYMNLYLKAYQTCQI